MSRARKFPVSAINIAMHEPHSSSRYVELFQGLYKMRKIVVMRGAVGALIGSLSFVDSRNHSKGIVGELYQFIHLDSNEPWFDLKNLEEATQDDLSEINIPDHLKPHLARFFYVFYPDGHRIYIQTRSKNRTFGIASAAKLMKLLLSDRRMLPFGDVEITVEPDKDTLSQIFRIKHLKKLDIDLVRPNPDDHEADERRLLRRLSRQGAKKMVVNLVAASDHDLEPDAETRTLAKVASSNGKVVGRGRDSGGQVITKSTTEKPMEENVVYFDEVQTEQAAFLQKAAEVHAKIRG